MKTFVFKNRISALFLLGALTSFAFTGCQTESMELDSTIESQLADLWQVNSFILDGTDILGKVVVSSQLHFIPGQAGFKGNFDWNIIYHSNDAAENIYGSYEINQANREITFTGTTGKLLKMHFALQDNQLELSGMHDNVPLLLKAEKEEQFLQK